MKQGDLHSIRGLQADVVIAPRGHYRFMHHQCSIGKHPFHGGF
ncbi:MAG: hypothetical protein V9E95_01240 [Methanothrix soehngenii]